jgi:sugar phosphate isomerase/epimerase
MNRDQIAIQLYTLREEASNDLHDTLQRMSSIGYKHVELAGMYGPSASQFRAMLDAAQLRAISAHIPIGEFEERLDKVVEDAQTLGCDWVVIPWINEELRSEQKLRELGEKMTVWGSTTAGAGMKFGYHNHNFEFDNRTTSGETLWEMLVKNTDPATVSFELDAYWAMRGGFDPATLLREYANRIGLLHLKDANKEDPTRDTPFGDGALDWGAILAAARAANVEWYIVEQDHPENVWADVSRSLANAQGLAQ